MRKKNLLLVVAFTGMAAVTFTSCSEDTTGTGPVITFLNNQTEVTLNPGQTSYTVAGTVTSDAGLKEVKFFKVIGDNETQDGQAVTSFSDKNNYPFQHDVTGITQEMKLKVQATDKDDITNSSSFTIKISLPAIQTWTGKTLGAQSSSTGSFFASVDGTVMTLNQATSNQAKADFAYYYGDVNLATLAAPDDASLNGGTGNFTWCQSWTTKNQTRFAPTNLTTAEFDAATATTINALADPAESKVTSLAQNKVIAFKTASGKKGLIKVTSITTGASGSITLDVKVQQ
ncbi:MAG TPA: hypothetical protein PLC81_02500 [Bacteroidales bacterium]|nr:hypothetical protein [Bacteroidales bacterium]HQK36478.1 hypothetical protein [Bacteroidales bacterium]